jgi:lipoprotein-anchoring transpeptidase ErfK/SrfK
MPEAGLRTPIDPGPGTPDEWRDMDTTARVPLLRQLEMPSMAELSPQEIEVEPVGPPEPVEPVAPQPEPPRAVMLPLEKLLEGMTETYIVQKDDTLRKIGARFRITDGLITRLNGLAGHIIHVDERLKVVRGPFRVVVDTQAMKLNVYLQDKHIKTYPVGLGTTEDATPTGHFRILDKVVNARWDYGGMHAPPGHPDNPTGSRWMKIARSYGIHGTNEPGTIGQRTSRGCIRMHNRDVEELYDLMRVGGEVTVQ